MPNTSNSKAYLVGAGIASLSAAVYLIQEGKFKGENITIFDESKKIGGSLDAQYLETGGYTMRGIRVFEERVYTCLFDLMLRIPSPVTPGNNLRQDFIEYNTKNKLYSASRLIRDGKAIDSRPLKLNLKDRISLFGLFFKSESSLESIEIRDYFTPDFFTSNFWYESCTACAFEPWHSLIEFRRYSIRFLQILPGIDTLEGLETSPYNQYEFLVLPIIDWLKVQGVNFSLNTKVTDINFLFGKDGSKTVSSIGYVSIDGELINKVVSSDDYVFATLGSMVANSTIGSMTKPAFFDDKSKSPAWTLWEGLAKKSQDFGTPSVFNSHIKKTKWTSFTLTIKDPLFFELMDKFVHEKVTAHSGLTIVDSNWFLSIMMYYKKCFLNQPEGVDVCWGYGLSSESIGNVVKKKMSECSGEEILTELVHHLGLTEHLKKILETTVCIPCSTPYVTSQFLPRKISDRPQVVPNGSVNFAILGQYCEIPEDVVFTVEYSIRSAIMAVYSLLKLNKKVPLIYKGTHHIGVLYRAFKTIIR